MPLQLKRKSIKWGYQIQCTDITKMSLQLTRKSNKWGFKWTKYKSLSTYFKSLLPQRPQMASATQYKILTIRHMTG